MKKTSYESMNDRNWTILNRNAKRLPSPPVTVPLADPKRAPLMYVCNAERLRQLMHIPDRIFMDRLMESWGQRPLFGSRKDGWMWVDRAAVYEACDVTEDMYRAEDGYMNILTEHALVVAKRSDLALLAMYAGSFINPQSN